MRWPRTIRRVLDSLSAKLAALVVVLALVPGLIYGLLERADAQRNELVVRTVQEQGRLIAAALFQHLERFSPDVAVRLGELLPTLAPDDSTIKVLFRPNDGAERDGFLFVAAYPEVSGEALARERREIIETGLLDRVTAACDSARPLEMPFRSAAGQEQILTYLGARKSDSGCWTVIASIDRAGVLGTAGDRPYWQKPEVQAAAAIYFTMAGLILWIFFALWTNLHRFKSVIAAIRNGHGDEVSFRGRNSIPELSSVAGEFDELVGALRRSESLIRQTAAENAHALKAPLAVMSQSLEPLRQTVGGAESPQARSLARIEQSIERLDGLISAARKIDETTAELLDRSPARLELPAALSTILEAYRLRGEARGVAIDVDIPGGTRILANADLFETAMENILANALDFAPDGSRVAITATPQDDGTVAIDVADSGPGVPADDLDRIFERYVSTRRTDRDTGNFGIGLWIARRNVEAMGGRVTAANRQPTGLRVRLELPAPD